MDQRATKSGVQVQKVLCQYAVFALAASSILFLKGTITIQAPALYKQMPLYLFCELALLALLFALFLYNCWNYIWDIPRRICEFRKNLQKKNIIQGAISNAYICALGVKRPISVLIPLNTDQDSTLAAICWALSADICARWHSLQDCANLMLANEQLKTLGHLYRAKVHNQNCNYKEELHELLITKSAVPRELVITLKDRLFLAFMRNVPNVEEAESVLSPQQMAVLLSEVGKTLPDKYTDAYKLDPNNVDAACFLASRWNETVAIKKLVSLLKVCPDTKVLDTIMQINTQLTRTEIYARIRNAISSESQSPSELYILARAAFAAGLRGEGIHYTKQAASAFHPLVSPRLHEFCETTEPISGRDVYECKNCHGRVMLQQSYCPQCAGINTLVWRVIAEY
ncbi:MAG: hypothetical protein LBF66_02355 [Holosporales bacterium]|jgi:hypothetical protein|nr:hypothetical protein [Holosporales bacterium]